MKEDKTIRYYNSNAREFVLGTVSVDFEFTQKKFTDRLPKNAAILDFGCGSGRDTKYFLSQGYRVDAVDGSAELCKLASEYTGIEEDRGELLIWKNYCRRSKRLYLPRECR